MKAQDFFKHYPDKDMCYETADGNLFFLHCDATNHGKTLKDALVIKHERGDRQEADEIQQPADEIQQSVGNDNSQQVDSKAKKKKTKK